MTGPLSRRRAILVLNGPNLNLLGQREPGIYGDQTLDHVDDTLRRIAGTRNFDTIFEQSNHEGSIIDLIHEHGNTVAGIIINPGAFTHYSIAIRDAFAAVKARTVEVHISNTAAREPFRHRSVISPVVEGSIAGLGVAGYELALQYLMDRFDDEE